MLSEGYSQLLPVYPLIAQQILDDYHITSGICIDIGTGPGYLGIELAKITSLEMYFLDINVETLNKAKNNVSGCGLENIVHFVKADVSHIPFKDDFADLIISRGSLWFWEDQVKGLQETYRILKPGGVAFIGGGLGRYTPLSMRQRLKGKQRRKLQAQGHTGFLDNAGFQDLLDKAHLKGCRLVSDVSGEDATWIEIRK